MNMIFNAGGMIVLEVCPHVLVVENQVNMRIRHSMRVSGFLKPTFKVSEFLFRI